MAYFLPTSPYPSFLGFTVDLKADNVLFEMRGSRPVVKIADMGKYRAKYSLVCLHVWIALFADLARDNLIAGAD